LFTFLGWLGVSVGRVVAVQAESGYQVIKICAGTVLGATEETRGEGGTCDTWRDCPGGGSGGGGGASPLTRPPWLTVQQGGGGAAAAVAI